MSKLILLAMISVLIASVFATESYDSKCKGVCVAKALKVRDFGALLSCFKDCKDQKVDLEVNANNHLENLSAAEFVALAESTWETYAQSASQQSKVLSDSYSVSKFSNGAQLCLNAGLNYRDDACGNKLGQISSSTTGSLQQTQHVDGSSCSAGEYDWLNVVLANGQNVWVASLDGYVSDCSDDSSSSPSTSSSQLLSQAQLQKIMPNLSSSKASTYIAPLNDALAWGSINTCARLAAFLAQVAHESGEFRYMEEIASGAAYEGRCSDLGNCQPGDGVKYKGRGPIQLTGRTNYIKAGNDLGVDLVNNPTLAATPQWGFKVSVWFWKTRSLNTYADQNTQDSFDVITKRINGGYNGKADRDMYWRRAKSVLGC